MSRTVGKAAGFVFKWALRRFLAGRAMQAEGLVDFGHRRCAIDYFAYAELIDGPRQWSGRSGRSIRTLPEEKARALSPLWLFDLLRGATEASEVARERVRGRSCRRLRARADLARVSAVVPGDMALPPGASFEELQTLPIEVWLDEDDYIRRIRFEYDFGFGAFGGGVHTVDFFDFGTKERMDWSRLPVFKTPGSRQTPLKGY